MVEVGVRWEEERDTCSGRKELMGASSSPPDSLQKLCFAVAGHGSA